MAFSVKLIETYPGFGPELTTDGNMEDTPTTNWPSVNVTTAVNTATVHGGCQSLRGTATADNGFIYQNVTVEAGHKYRIGAWGRSSAAGHRWQLRIGIAGVTVWASDWHTNAAWEEEVKFYRIPNGITGIDIRLRIETNGEIVYFDDVTVKREAPVPMTTIDLFYSATDTWAMLEKGFMPNDPERRETWGGHLEDQLVRQEDGKRVIPLKLHGEWATTDALIDDVNGLEEVLRHAARYRKDGWGGECFLEFQLHSATHGIWYPVCSGQIDKGELMNACASIMTEGHRVTKNLVEVGVTVVCEPYWESSYTYDLANLLNNPGFEEWNSGICDSEPDGWADYEWVSVGTHTNNQETDIVAEGGEAVRIEVNGIADAEYKGVSQDISARLQADTEYTYLAWVQNEAITNGLVGVRVRVAGVGDIATALNSGLANADYTRYSCQFRPTAAHIAAGVHAYAYILATANGCIGIAHIDKMLVMESSNVPTAWMSSSYLMNHYDRGANHINYLSVCDVPGEVEAETSVNLVVGQDFTEYIHIAKRTRDNPHDFIWQLQAVNANLGLDAAMVPDANAPGGQNITVNFATSKIMFMRLNWQVGSPGLPANLAAYYGNYGLIIICKKSNATDIINMKMHCFLEAGTIWTQGLTIKQAVPFVAAATHWDLLGGWEVFSFPIGTHDNDLWGAGNEWQIEVYAENKAAGAAATSLLVAGAYIVPLDEGYLMTGGVVPLAGNDQIVSISHLDGDIGVFAHSTSFDTYYPNLGAVGKYPLLTPKIENWLYLAWEDASPGYVITRTQVVSIKYRPRGIFLRGLNP